MSTSARHSVSVAAAILRDDGRVLAIQRRDNSHWEPPGGVLEHGETIAQALLREVAEETGVTVTGEHLTGIYQNMPRNIIAFVFRCNIASGEPRPTDEARAVEWLTPAQVRERMTEAFAVRILDALDDTADWPVIRQHDGVRLLDSRASTIGTATHRRHLMRGSQGSTIQAPNT